MWSFASYKGGEGLETLPCEGDTIYLFPVMTIYNALVMRLFFTKQEACISMISVRTKPVQLGKQKQQQHRILLLLYANDNILLLCKAFPPPLLPFRLGCT